MEKKSKMSSLLLADYEKKKKELGVDNQSPLDKKTSLPKETPVAEKEKKESAPDKEKVSEADKVKKAVQKRIDELVAKNKQKDAKIRELEAKVADALYTKDAGEKKQDLKETYRNTLKDLSVLRKKQLNAEEVELESLIVSEMETLEKLQELKMRMEENKSAGDAEKLNLKAADRSRKWSEGIKRAVELFPDIFSSEKGRFNTEDALYRKAMEILTADGEKPKYNLALAKAGFLINPRFDHGDGFYTAVLEAANSLELKNSSEEASRTKKENERLKAKEQLLSGGLYPQAIGGKAKEDAEITSLRDKMFAEGADSPAGIEYYRRIRNRTK